jgi:Fe-S cluster assembly ATP-binding protein
LRRWGRRAETAVYYLLEIRKLHVSVGERELLRGLDLTIRAGETHVLMGQNGAGKSTLAGAVMGSPVFTVTSGEILFEGEDITRESADKRARRGIFLSFQNPEEVPGVTLESFIRAAKGAVDGAAPRMLPFRRELTSAMEQLGIPGEYAGRELNVGFSGGEKKKSEILQLLELRPKLAMLDETDSGLDVDALRTVTDGIRSYKGADNALLIITHNSKLAEGVGADFVHVLENGRISVTGGPELIGRITEGGFGPLGAL